MIWFTKKIMKSDKKMAFDRPGVGAHPADLGPVGMIIPLIVMIAMLIVTIYLVQFIYKDAMKRSLNAELWLLISLLVPVLSWIIYFIVRKVEPPKTIGNTTAIK